MKAVVSGPASLDICVGVFHMSRSDKAEIAQLKNFVSYFASERVLKSRSVTFPGLQWPVYIWTAISSSSWSIQSGNPRRRFPFEIVACR